MCGKFTQRMFWEKLVELSDIVGAPSGGPREAATPMRFANVIRLDR